MKNSQRGFAVPFLLALIAFLVAGAGAYVYVEKKQGNNPSTFLNQATSTETVSNTETFGWKTYTNTQYGFSLNYPGDLKVEENSSERATNSVFTVKIYDANYKAPEGTVGQQVRAEQKSVIINILENSDENLDSIKKIIALGEPKDKTSLWSEKVITVDGKNATFYALWSGLVGPHYEGYLSNGKYIFDLTSFQGDLLGQILSTFKFTPSNAPASISVPGMSKYTDAEFGFSFWYPSSWKVVAGQDSIRLYDSQGRDTDLGIQKSVPANGKLLLPGYACGPAEGCADLTYYFDATIHTWMMQSGTKAATPADVSVNTMGGLHMLNGNIRFGLGTVVPLSAHNFLKVGAAPGGLGGGQRNFQDYLARTIIATDPGVATSVSVAEQIKTIQAEKNAYAPDLPHIDSLVPSSVSIGSTVTISGRNFDWIPPTPCEGNGCAMRSEQPVSVTLTNSSNQSQVLWLGNRDSIGTIPVTVPPGQPCVFANGIGGCARGAYVITPGQYSLSVSVDGRGKSNSVPITITN